MRLWLLPILLLVGCTDLANRIDNQVLDCGDEVRGSSDLWIKVLDPTGGDLPESEQLDARALVLDSNGTLPPALPGPDSGWRPRRERTGRWRCVVAARRWRRWGIGTMPDQLSSRHAMPCLHRTVQAEPGWA